MFGQIVTNGKATHSFKTQVADIGPGAADEHNQYFGDIDSELLIQGLIVMDYDIDNLEEKTVFDVAFVQHFRCISSLEHFCKNLFNEVQHTAFFGGRPNLQSFVELHL